MEAFAPAFSYSVARKDQAEIDRYGDKLLEGGQTCGLRLANGQVRPMPQIVPEKIGRRRQNGKRRFPVATPPLQPLRLLKQDGALTNIPHCRAPIAGNPGMASCCSSVSTTSTLRFRGLALSSLGSTRSHM